MSQAKLFALSTMTIPPEPPLPLPTPRTKRTRYVLPPLSGTYSPPPTKSPSPCLQPLPCLTRVMLRCPSCRHQLILPTKSSTSSPLKDICTNCGQNIRIWETTHYVQSARWTCWSCGKTMMRGEAVKRACGRCGYTRDTTCCVEWSEWEKRSGLGKEQAGGWWDIDVGGPGRGNMSFLEIVLRGVDIDRGG